MLLTETVASYRSGRGGQNPICFELARICMTKIDTTTARTQHEIVLAITAVPFGWHQPLSGVFVCTTG